MKWNTNDIERVRNLPIASLFQLPVGRRLMIKCPFPEHADGTASFLIDERNGYKCFGCGKHGHNFIDFCTEFHRQLGTDEREIFKKIMEEYS